jgi:hypothetical protein
LNLTNINELIAENQTVETRLSNYPNWISSQIIKIDSESIHVEFNEEYLKMLLTVGDIFNIKFETKEAQYILNGFVENVIITAPPKIIIKIENILKHENDRKSLRFNSNFLCRVLPEDEQFKIQGITTDISESGISIVSYADFNIQNLVYVEIIAPNVDVLKFKGNIKRLKGNTSNHIQYGIEITEIDNENRSILHRIISTLENK